MNNLRHASLARQLIERCGDLDEAARECRVGRSNLSDYQNPHKPLTMPADVIFALEAYCGEPIYSRALFEARPGEPVAGEVLGETHDVAMAAAALLPLAMDVKAGKPGALDRYRSAVAHLVDEVDDVEAIADGNVSFLRGAA